MGSEGDNERGELFSIPISIGTLQPKKSLDQSTSPTPIPSAGVHHRPVTISAISMSMEKFQIISDPRAGDCPAGPIRQPTLATRVVLISVIKKLRAPIALKSNKFDHELRNVLSYVF